MNQKKLTTKTRYIICIILMWIGHLIGFVGLIIREDENIWPCLYMTIVFFVLLIYFVVRFIKYCSHTKDSTPY